MMYVVLIAGMLLLVKGADYFVDGSASVAKILKVPSLIIGLTIVALGTSLPEASVSITASIAGNNELALSNIIGSNIFNTLVVVGCSAMIAPFIMDRDIIKRDLIINLIVSVSLCLFIFDGILGRMDGILLLIGLVTFMMVLIRSVMRYDVEEEIGESFSISKSIILIVIGCCHYPRGKLCGQWRQRYCPSVGNERNLDWIDHCFDWNFSAGACDQCGRSA